MVFAAWAALGPYPCFAPAALQPWGVNLLALAALAALERKAITSSPPFAVTLSTTLGYTKLVATTS